MRVTCVCGVVIREVNDVIRIDQCDQRYGNPHTSPIIKVYNGPLREGTSIQRSRDGSRITVSARMLQISIFLYLYLHLDIRSLS